MGAGPGGGLGGLIGGMLGGGAPGMGGQGNNAFGNTRGMMPGRYVDIALFTRNRPAGTEGVQAIPPGVQLGESLPLLPHVREPAPGPGRAEPGEPGMERPRGRLLLYWGCGEQVRAGQPRVIDFARAQPQDWANAWQGRFGEERGATARDGNSVWPNERDRRSFPRESSLVGEHTVTGDGVPAGLRFQLQQAQDFMPAIELVTSGTPAQSIQLSWSSVANARAYFANAMGARGDDMILWSSSELPDAGFGLLDYLSPANIDRWTKDRVLMPASQTNCAVPSGIFNGVDSPMVRMAAHGPELNLAHPPRPADPKAVWEPQWAVRVRTKAQTMAMLGEERRGGRGAQSAPAERPASGQTERKADETPSIIPGGAREIFRGIFGR